MPPILCIVGPSGSGKTTLIEKLLPELAARGLRVGTIKHSSHGFEMDREGKDTWRHRRAGSVASLIVTEGKLALLRDLVEEPSLEGLVARHLDGLDLVLAEGFKQEGAPKVEVFRRGCGDGGLLTSKETGLVAVVSDEPGIDASAGVQVFRPEEAGRIADHVLWRIGVAAVTPSSPAAEGVEIEIRFDGPPAPWARPQALGAVGRALRVVLSALTGTARGETAAAPRRGEAASGGRSP